MEKMNLKTKKINGITLIALVITIIVLLILAGVSIAMLTGESGIIKQAEKARLLNEIGSIKEAMDMNDISKQGDVSYKKRLIFGTLGEILGKEFAKYDKQYGVEAGNVVYKDNQFSKEEKEILEENGIEKESKHYLIMNESTKENKYAEREEAITLKQLQDKITKIEFSGSEGKYNKAYIIEDLDLGATWNEEGSLISGEEWTPITLLPENTVLDGCGFSIKGLYTNKEKGSQALINNNSGILKDLTMSKDCCIGGSDLASAFSVSNSSTGKIIKCKNLANINGTGRLASCWNMLL